jgi:Zn-dependent protease with chaperone function
MPCTWAGFDVPSAPAGPGVFFDGKTSARQPVWIEVGPAGLIVRDREGEILLRWPCHELQRLAAPGELLRLARRGSPVSARIEIRDVSLAAAIGELVERTQPPALAEGRGRVVAWSLAAAVAVLAVAMLGISAIAERLAPLIPLALEEKVGDALEREVRAMLNSGASGSRLECGSAAAEAPGRLALDEMVQHLVNAAALPIPASVTIIRHGEANAFALPGGRIYVLEGLLAKAESPDELAGVLAHELGHVAHRDGMKAMVRTGGLGLLFGMVVGDFVGGGAMVVTARALLNTAYPREVESAADAYAVSLMLRIGGDARGLGSILLRSAGRVEPSMRILADHPETESRVSAINQAAPLHRGPPILGAASWAALKRICSGS